MLFRSELNAFADVHRFHHQTSKLRTENEYILVRKYLQLKRIRSMSIDLGGLLTIHAQLALNDIGT